MKTFQDKVFALVSRIPRGRVSTYKAIADKIGVKAYRAVGQVLKKNPYDSVPCHRVVCSDGSLGGYHGIASSKKKMILLKKEDIKIKNNKVEDFEKRIFIHY
ncbi:methylated-DNA--[protein]-cysteine S-methyltransferase [Candidatus Woesearchaeota archaeon]|nr:methylated-DNA--[protein]-cysteine S-methyltransferase [Candidatus Woesearchaeota archaeon]